jgi:opacity protein-like surface antigen
MLLENQISKYALRHGCCSLATADRSVEWLGSLPLRGGITFDRTLIYATGGFAAGDVDMRLISINGNISGHALAPGWTVGAGKAYWCNSFAYCVAAFGTDSNTKLSRK